MISTIRNKLSQWSSYKKDLKETNKWKYYALDLVETIIVALVLALIIRKFVVQTSMVYSGSMIPTMMIGDRLFVNKFIYTFQTPKRGDIILFKSPYKDGKEFVKRLVALPGETVEIKKGIVFINGKEIAFPGVDVQRDYSYFGPEVVPADSYFALGDNRGNSADSRVWGYVPRQDLLGEALFTFWPLNRMQLLR